ncbi:hypothetical protein DFJ63DRAFT_334401 [Scheffersomyces coipomensis]|uniref:uncharacterized protein n=1 Tax=Scheffersomyces coipomensis TaxID=1788519 RepID=UPI00315CCBD6
MIKGGKVLLPDDEEDDRWKYDPWIDGWNSWKKWKNWKETQEFRPIVNVTLPANSTYNGKEAGAIAGGVFGGILDVILLFFIVLLMHECFKEVKNRFKKYMAKRKERARIKRIQRANDIEQQFEMSSLPSYQTQEGPLPAYNRI